MYIYVCTHCLRMTRRTCEWISSSKLSATLNFFIYIYIKRRGYFKSAKIIGQNSWRKYYFIRLVSRLMTFYVCIIHIYVGIHRNILWNNKVTRAQFGIIYIFSNPFRHPPTIVHPINVMRAQSSSTGPWRARVADDSPVSECTTGPAIYVCMYVHMYGRSTNGTREQ